MCDLKKNVGDSMVTVPQGSMVSGTTKHDVDIYIYYSHMQIILWERLLSMVPKGLSVP